MFEERRFHPDFGVSSESRRDILQSSDNTYFYYSLTTLRGLSSFFSGLPGTTIPTTAQTTAAPIHLEHAPSEALGFCLRAIDRLVRPGTTPTLYRDLLPDILKLCDVYDLPCVPLFIHRHRHLLGFRLSPDLEAADPMRAPAKAYVDDPFLDFGLAVLANDDNEAVRASKRCAFCDINEMPRWLRDLMVRLAPIYYIRLHEMLSLQLRCRWDMSVGMRDDCDGLFDDFDREFEYCGQDGCALAIKYGPGIRGVIQLVGQRLFNAQWNASDLADPHRLAQESVADLPCEHCRPSLLRAVLVVLEDSLYLLPVSI